MTSRPPPRRTGDTTEVTQFAAPLDIRFVHSLEGAYRFLDRPQDDRGPQVLACRTISFSPATIVLAAAVIGVVGERVAAAFPHLGEVTGAVVQTGRSGFEIKLDATSADQARLAATINWLKRRHVRTAVNKRAARRVPLGGLQSAFEFEGAQVPCTIIDVSVSGAAIAAEVTPPLGTEITIGSVSGTVRRHLQAGFAIHFTDTQPVELLRTRLTSAGATETAPGAADDGGGATPEAG